MSRLRPAVARWLALSLVLAACTGAHPLPVTGSAAVVPATAPPTVPPTTAPSPTTTGPPGVWQPCNETMQCATLQVPLDYSHADGAKIPIALERRPASGLRVGNLLLNPGGPGESGIADMHVFQSILSPALLNGFDLVTFDPRGVGQSAGISCLDGPALDAFFHVDPAPTSSAAFAALVAAERQLAAGCQARHGAELPFVGTVNAARDMDAIRQFLGEDRLTFLGFSYGSLLGATYADLYPTHVRAMVLDGAIDPTLDPVTLDDQQAAGFDRELNAFFADCAASATCAWKPGGDLHAAFDRLLASIRAHPLVVGTRSVGPGEAFYGVVVPLYDRHSWGDLAAALQRASQGDGGGLLQLFDVYTERRAGGAYPDTLQANTAINCADQQWPANPGAYPSLAAAAARMAPEFGPANIYSSLACAVWPFRATARPHPLRAAGSPPILVVGSTDDPATPYAWARAMAGQLQRGVLLTRQGRGHTAYEFSACVRAQVDAYLVARTVPAAGTVCPSSG